MIPTRKTVGDVKVDKIHEAFGTSVHKIPKEVFNEILKADYGKTVVYRGKTHTVTVRLKAAAKMALDMIP